MLPSGLIRLLLFVVDLFSIAFSILLVSYLLPDGEMLYKQSKILFPYFTLIPLLFFYEGIYTRNYDFWHESRLIIHTLSLTFLLVIGILLLTPSLHLSHVIYICLIYLVMFFGIPGFKRMFKITVYKKDRFRKPVKILNESDELASEVYGNPYLGYRRCIKDETPYALIINSRDTDPTTLRELIEREMQCHKEVLFIPYLNDYDLTLAQLYELTNTRSNLILLQNRLLSNARRRTKVLIDLGIALVLTPLLLPFMLCIAGLIKWSDPNGTILFRQKRIGYRGKVFFCYKFRTMQENGERLLEEYLMENPDEKEYYRQYHKYRHDPRVTKIGRFLRKSSLDELPQIFNVLKGEMSFVGPRPYMLEERGEVGEALETILKVRPGITGLWQVSGRNRLEFSRRIEMDLWYIRNWNLWLDIVVLLKTFKSIWKREGAL